MKYLSSSLILFICLFNLLLPCVYSNKKTVLKKNFLRNEKASKKDITSIGETYTQDYLIPQTDAITTAEATVNYTPYIQGYSSVQIIDHLQDQTIHPKRGPKESINEIATPIRYYDGGLNLNKVTVNCSIYTTLDSCLNSSLCGWCGSSGQCILGQNAGPYAPCLKGFTISSKPQEKELIRYVTEPVGSVRSTIINRQ
jgi:hypothetical protein